MPKKVEKCIKKIKKTGKSTEEANAICRAPKARAGKKKPSKKKVGK